MNDSKNYHCWQYRQWFINKFDLLDGEIEYTNRLLLNDVRNNSAWNHRFYVQEKLGKLKDKDCDYFKNELEFVLEKIKLAPNNESSWNYLVGIIGDDKLNDYEIVNRFMDEVDKTNEQSAFFYSFKLDQMMLKLDQMNENSNDRLQLIDKSLELAGSLAKVHDKIREKYWNYIAQTIEKKYLK